MNWPRGLAISVLALCLATFILVGFGVAIVAQTQQALDNQGDVLDNQDVARARNECVSETYVPFYQAIGQALVDLNDQGRLQPETALALEAANQSLATLNERCPT